MKLTISTVALVAFAAFSAAAAGAGQDRIPDAQRPGAEAQKPAADAQRPATMDAPAMTITGCVARGTAADTFTLAEVKKDAPVAADASAPAALVALTGTEVDLSKHVGHSVTLTGSYATPNATVGTSGTEKPATPAAPEDSKKAAKTFTVKSLKMVSPTC
jgi:hypothetical protein